MYFFAPLKPHLNCAMSFNEGFLSFVVENFIFVCTVVNIALDAFVILHCPLFFLCHRLYFGQCFVKLLTKTFLLLDPHLIVSVLL